MKILTPEVVQNIKAYEEPAMFAIEVRIRLIIKEICDQQNVSPLFLFCVYFNFNQLEFGVKLLNELILFKDFKQFCPT